MALFEDNGLKWTNKALDLDHRVQGLLRPLIEQAVTDGENLREVMALVHGAACNVESLLALEIRFKKPAP